MENEIEQTLSPKQLSCMYSARWGAKNKNKITACSVSRYKNSRSLCLAIAAKSRSKNRERLTAYMAEWRRRNPEKGKAYSRKSYRKAMAINPQKLKDKNRSYKLKAAYGISLAEYAAMYAKCSGLCAICRRSFPPGGQHGLHVDHNHETGMVRELLCLTCNTGLGKFQENSAWLRSAIDYLRRNS